MFQVQPLKLELDVIRERRRFDLHYANEAEEKLENIKCDIRYCRERIEGIRTSLTKTNVELKHDRIQTSPNPDAMLDGICRILEIEDELSRLIKEGTEFIGQLDSEQMRKVCILFYIKNAKVYDIAQRLQYTSRRINQLKQEANVQLSELFANKY